MNSLLEFRKMKDGFFAHEEGKPSDIRSKKGVQGTKLLSAQPGVETRGHCA